MQGQSRPRDLQSRSSWNFALTFSQCTASWIVFPPLHCSCEIQFQIQQELTGVPPTPSLFPNVQSFVQGEDFQEKGFLLLKGFVSKDELGTEFWSPNTMQKGSASATLVFCFPFTQIHFRQYKCFFFRFWKQPGVKEWKREWRSAVSSQLFASNIFQHCSRKRQELVEGWDPQHELGASETGERKREREREREKVWL